MANESRGEGVPRRPAGSRDRLDAGRLIPHPIFDTQVAAMVCGFGESVSYVNLVKQVTGRDLDKTSRFTDWSRRPLSQKQLTYALGDVTYLRDIYRHLKAELEATDRARLARRGDGGRSPTRAPTRPIPRTPGSASSCGSRTARGWRC